MNYILAVFNSRTQTMLFYNKLKAQKIPCSIINTPKQTNVACGICVKFFSRHINDARRILNNTMTGFIGFYNYVDAYFRNKISPL